MKVGIYGQTNNDITIKYTKRLIEILQERKIEFLLEKKFSEGFANSAGKEFPSFDGYEELDETYEVFFTVGGDGTFLRSVTLVRDLGIPIIGINTGRLGFLATVPKENIAIAVEQICNKEFRIGKRSLLSVRSSDGNQDFDGLNFALNEDAFEPFAIFGVAGCESEPVVGEHARDLLVASFRSEAAT